ncbi:uncharacterized protein si:ch211-244b2.4 [Thunnus albacares]|uniref:uncharacterized protein si:ch211-244b2.4 n=1 Tax=Thunnus albacares TaxID=8236 RepID=UPI001CF66520|nr:uncharacterized protein si:ch211-244b2.4 [Thunnus albacares]
MASAAQSDEENTSEAESYVSDETDSDEYSDEESDDGQREPCKFYNRGSCRDGDECPYLHVCKFALKGNCRNGSKCKLKHPGGGRSSFGGSNRSSDRSTSTDEKLTDGRCFQWQLNDGSCWKDVDNDHIIEAQYSLPHTKSIKIYNTQYGAVSIDFNKMRVYGKRLKVRRLDDGNTVWIWYCTLSHKWIKYGEKDSKGNPSPVKNSDIEVKFQSNPTSSFTFRKGSETFEIKFPEMRQVSHNRKRRVTRRPVYQQQQAGAAASQAAQGLQNLNIGTKPQWQFEGDSGKWHEFKQRRGSSTESSVTSDDIERKFQQNPNSKMTFKVNGHSYQLDFGAMIQTNLKTKHTRNIRRVLV